MFPPSNLTTTLTVAQLDDDNALVAAIATAVAPVTFTGVTMDGAFANPGPATRPIPQHPTLTTSASVGSYNLAAVVFNGTDDGGATIAVSVTPTQINGGEVVVGATAMRTVTSIVVPAQVDINGQWEFGMQDAVATPDHPIVAVRHGTQANIELEFDGDVTDTLPGEVGERQEVVALKVLANATTSTPVTIFRGKSPYRAQ